MNYDINDDIKAIARHEKAITHHKRNLFREGHIDRTFLDDKKSDDENYLAGWNSADQEINRIAGKSECIKL